MDYKDFYHAAEEVLKTEEFDRIIRFMEMKRLKDRLDFPELYKELDNLDENVIKKESPTFYNNSKLTD